ncbi:MAG TPA: hypothetical protein VH437_20315 [Terriglobales bacterium]|jgi:hypothetical protein
MRLNRYLSTLACVVLTALLVVQIEAEQPPEIPAGITVSVRMIDRLNSEEAQVGDTFSATLELPIIANGKEIYPKGANVSGRIIDVHKSGRLTDPGELDLVLTTISTGRSAVSIAVQSLVIKGESHTKSNAGKIGAGAAIGAIIGGIAGGGKGAAIGAGAGGAAGTGAAAATGKKPAMVDSEAILNFTTTSANVPLPPETQPAEAPAPDQTSPDQAPTTTPPADSEPPPSSPDSSSTPDNNATLFSMRDRRVIRECVKVHEGDFPPSVIGKSNNSQDFDAQLRPGAILSSNLQERVRSLPLDCEEQLPKLPPDQERVLFNGCALLVDSSYQILDVFALDNNQ